MAANCVFHDPDLRVPRRPLAPHRIYHFNVIYNYGPGSDSGSQAEDMELALRVTRALVSRLEMKGYVNSYYHDRDFRRLNQMDTELERVLRGSSVTVLILTPGFLPKCRQLYFSSDSFSRLIGAPRSTRRLLSLGVGIVRRQVPPELTAEDVLYFGRDWELDIPMWDRVDRTVETLSTSSYYPQRECCICYDDWKMKPRECYQDQYPTSHKRTPNTQQCHSYHELGYKPARNSTRFDQFLADIDMIDSQLRLAEQNRLDETKCKRCLNKDLDLHYHERGKRLLAESRMQDQTLDRSNASPSTDKLLDTNEAPTYSGYNCSHVDRDFEMISSESHTHFSIPCGHRKSDAFGLRKNFGCSDSVLLPGYGEKGEGFLRDEPETSYSDKSFNKYSEGRKPSLFQNQSSSELPESSDQYITQTFDDYEKRKESHSRQNGQLFGHIDAGREIDRLCKHSEDLNRWTCADKWNKWTQETALEKSKHGVLSHRMTDEFKLTSPNTCAKKTNECKHLVASDFTKRTSSTPRNQSFEMSQSETSFEYNRWAAGGNPKWTSTQDFARSLPDDILNSRLDAATTTIALGKQWDDKKQYKARFGNQNYGSRSLRSFTDCTENLENSHTNSTKPKGTMRSEGRDEYRSVNLTKISDDKTVHTRGQNAFYDIDIEKDSSRTSASDSSECETYRSEGYSTKTLNARTSDCDRLISTESTQYNYSPSLNKHRHALTHSYGTSRDKYHDYSTHDSFESYEHEDFEYPVRDSDRDLHTRPMSYSTQDVHRFNTPTESFDVFSSSFFGTNQRTLNGHSSLPHDTQILTDNVSKLYPNNDWGSSISGLYWDENKPPTNIDVTPDRSVIDTCLITSDCGSKSANSVQTYPPALAQDEDTSCKAEINDKCQDFIQVELPSQNLEDSVAEKDFTFSDNYTLYDSTEEVTWYSGSQSDSWSHQLADCVMTQIDSVGWDNSLDSTFQNPKICVSSISQNDFSLDMAIDREDVDKQYRGIGTEGDKYESWDTPIHLSIIRDVDKKTELEKERSHNPASLSIQENTQNLNEYPDIQLLRLGSLNQNQIQVGPNETQCSTADVKSVKGTTENIVAANIVLDMKKETALKAFLLSAKDETRTHSFDKQGGSIKQDTNIKKMESDSTRFEASAEHVTVTFNQTKVFSYADDNTPAVPVPTQFPTPQYNLVGAYSKQADDVGQSKINSSNVFDVQYNTEKVSTPVNIISQGNVAHSLWSGRESSDPKFESPSCALVDLNLEENTTSHTICAVEQNSRPAFSQDKIITEDSTVTDLTSSSGELTQEHEVSSGEIDQWNIPDVLTKGAQRGGNKVGDLNTTASHELTKGAISGNKETEEIINQNAKTEEINHGIVKTEKINEDSVVSKDLSGTFLKVDTINDENSETKEIHYMNVNTHEINRDLTRSNEVNHTMLSQNITELKEINQDTVKTEVDSDIVKIDEINGDIVKIDEINGDTVKTEDFNHHTVKTEEINVDTVKTEGINQDTIKIEDINRDTVKTKELNLDTVKTKELNLDTVKTKELNLDTVKTKELNLDTVKTEELNLDTVKTKELNLDTVRSKIINSNTVKTEEINCDTAKTGDIRRDIVETKDINLDIVKTEDSNRDTVKTENIHHDIVKTEEINFAALTSSIAISECKESMKEAEELIYQAMNIEEINNETLYPGITSCDTGPLRDETEINATAHNINMESVVAQTVTPETVSVQEVGRNGASCEIVHHENVSAEDKNLDFKTEESNLENWTAVLNAGNMTARDRNLKVMTLEDIVVENVTTEIDLRFDSNIKNVTVDINLGKITTEDKNLTVKKLESNLENVTENKNLVIVSSENKLTNLEKVTEDKNMEIVRSENTNLEKVTEDKNLDIVSSEATNLENVTEDKNMQIVRSENTNLENVTEEKNLEIVRSENANLENMTEDKNRERLKFSEMGQEVIQVYVTAETNNVNNFNLVVLTNEEINQSCVRDDDFNQNTESSEEDMFYEIEDGRAIEDLNRETVAGNEMNDGGDKRDDVDVEDDRRVTPDISHVTAEETNNKYVEGDVDEVNFKADDIADDASQSRHLIISTERDVNESKHTANDTVFAQEVVSEWSSVDKTKMISSEVIQETYESKYTDVLDNEAELRGDELDNTNLQNDVLSFQVDEKSGMINEPVETSISRVGLLDTTDSSREKLKHLSHWTGDIMNTSVCPDNEIDTFSISYILKVTACDRVEHDNSEVEQCPVSNISSVHDNSEVEQCPVSNISSVYDNSEVEQCPVSNISSVHDNSEDLQRPISNISFGHDNSEDLQLPVSNISSVHVNSENLQRPVSNISSVQDNSEDLQRPVSSISSVHDNSEAAQCPVSNISSVYDNSEVEQCPVSNISSVHDNSEDLQRPISNISFVHDNSEFLQCPVSNISSVHDNSEDLQRPVSNISSVHDNSEVKQCPVSNISSVHDSNEELQRPVSNTPSVHNDILNKNQNIMLKIDLLGGSDKDTLKSNTYVSDELENVAQVKAEVSGFDNYTPLNEQTETINNLPSSFAELQLCIVDSTNVTKYKYDDFSEKSMDSQLDAEELTVLKQDIDFTDASLELLGKSGEIAGEIGDNLEDFHRDSLLFEEIPVADKCLTSQANLGQEMSLETGKDPRVSTHDDDDEALFGMEKGEFIRQKADIQLNDISRTVNRSRHGRDSVNVTPQTSKTFTEFYEGLSHEFNPNLNKTGYHDDGSITTEPDIGLTLDQGGQTTYSIDLEHTVTTQSDQVDGLEKRCILAGGDTSSRDQNTGLVFTEITYQNSTDEAQCDGSGIADVSYTSTVADEDVCAGHMLEEHLARTHDTCTAKEWILPVYKGVCHSLTNPEMPFMG